MFRESIAFIMDSRHAVCCFKRRHNFHLSKIAGLMLLERELKTKKSQCTDSEDIKNYLSVTIVQFSRSGTNIELIFYLICKSYQVSCCSSNDFELLEESVLHVSSSPLIWDTWSFLFFHVLLFFCRKLHNFDLSNNFLLLNSG